MMHSSVKTAVNTCQGKEITANQSYFAEDTAGKNILTYERINNTEKNINI